MLEALGGSLSFDSDVDVEVAEGPDGVSQQIDSDVDISESS